MDQCIFCKIANHEIPSNFLYEDDICVAFLDLSQTTYGHTLVVPKAHVKNILESDDLLTAHLFKVTNQLAKQICTALNANGCNILSNANEVAGQTVMHFHIHIIPRYKNNDAFNITFPNHEGQYDLDELVTKIKHPL